MTPQQLQAAAFQLAVYLMGPAILGAFGAAWTLYKRIQRDHARIRECFDVGRRVAYVMQLADPANEEIRAIRAKATRIADEMWREEGNVPRRLFLEDDTKTQENGRRP